MADSIEMPRYIKSTYIDSTTIRSPVIEGGEFYGEEFNIIAGSDYGSFNLYGHTGTADSTCWRLNITRAMLHTSIFTAPAEDISPSDEEALVELFTLRAMWILVVQPSKVWI